VLCNKKIVLLIMNMNDPRISFFDNLALEWDKNQPPVDELTSRLDLISDLLQIRNGISLLEVGCGTGLITPWLIQKTRPGRVVSIDFSQEMITEAKRKNPSGDFRLMDICLESPEVESFDNVFCFNSFPHFRDKQRALRNIFKSLKFNGCLVVLHFQGSKQINEFHKQVGGAVANDFLPGMAEWHTLLNSVSLKATAMIDREDLFLVKAYKV